MVTLEYDGGASDEIMERIAALFSRENILVEKKTKKGMAETDIRPMIQSLEVTRASGQELRMEAVICAQEPSLNPQLLIRAVERYLPQNVPDFAWARRIEAYDGDMEVFR